MHRLTRGVDPLVFWGSVGAATVFVLWGVLGTDSLANVMDDVLGWVIRNFGWAFLTAATGFVLFAVWLAFSRYGRVKFGGRDDRPEFSTHSWLAMIFTSGIGGGIIYWGVIEWSYYYVEPPMGIQPRSTEAADWAATYPLFH